MGEVCGSWRGGYAVLSTACSVLTLGGLYIAPDCIPSRIRLIVDLDARHRRPWETESNLKARIEDHTP